MDYRYSKSSMLTIIFMTIFVAMFISAWISIFIANLPPSGVQIVQGG